MKGDIKMSGIKLKRVTLTGVAGNIEVTMDTKCLKVMVKNLTDEDIFVGIGKADEVTTDNSVLIKSNCYQILMINENEDCFAMFDKLTVNGTGNGTVEFIQILY